MVEIKNIEKYINILIKFEENKKHRNISLLCKVNRETNLAKKISILKNMTLIDLAETLYVKPVLLLKCQNLDPKNMSTLKTLELYLENTILKMKA